MSRLGARCVLVFVTLAPAHAAAQQDPFIQTFLEFHSLLAGISGDEGPEILSSLDTMARVPLPDLHTFQRELERRHRDVPLLPPAAYAAAYARIMRGEYREATAEFRRVAASDPLVTTPAARSPSSSEAHRVRGLSYWTKAQDDRAIAELEAAIRLSPRDERARIALARVLGSAGREVDAERLLLETVDVLPDSALAYWWLGWGYERLNRFADARRAYERAAGGAVAGRSRLYAMLGRLASSGADVEGAIEAFRRAVDVNPDDSILREQLAGALLLQGRADEAFGEFGAALRIDPKNGRAHAGVGRIHLDAGRHEEAVTALRRSVELSPNDADARYALATALMRLGKTQEAAREFERVAEAQRQALDERRRSMKLDVQKEGEAFGASPAPPK